MREGNFASLLKRLRSEKGLNNTELAKMADVPRPFLAGIQSGRRRLGEYSARKIGLALGLTGEALDQFTLKAIDTCTEKVLEDARDYPSLLLNLIPMQLVEAGIGANDVISVQADGSDVALTLTGGRIALIKSQLQIG